MEEDFVHSRGNCFNTWDNNDDNGGRTWTTERLLLTLDDDDSEDVYEMALEVLEGDEAYCLESSGSISPESDVDRLLENADVDRFSGDVTLLRIFSVCQDEIRDCRGKRNRLSAKNSSEMNSGHEKSQEKRNVEELLYHERTEADDNISVGDRKSELEAMVKETSAGARNNGYDCDSADFSDSRSVQSDDLIRPNWTMEEEEEETSELVHSATFTNVTSKDARILTSLTMVHSLDECDAPPNRTDSDVSLQMTSSDSLYSTDDCFSDSPSAVHCTRQDPSPEDLFDEALETRSDLAASICSSSQRSPDQCSFYDALQSTPDCFRREPSPEDAFELALETLSDVIDDSSSSVFFIVPRSSDVTKRETSTPIQLLLDGSANHVTGNIDIGSDGSSISCSRSSSVFRSDGRRKSSCEEILLDDETPSPFDSLMKTTESRDQLINDECSVGDSTSDVRRLPVERLSSLECPSSPEPWFLTEYSTDECVEESEEDSSVTDYDGSTGPDRSSRNNFFQLLLRRRRFQETMNLWTDEDTPGTEEDLLDQIQICSIEDLVTDSDIEKESWNVKTQNITCLEEINATSPIFSLFHSKGPIFLQPPRNDNQTKEESATAAAASSASSSASATNKADDPCLLLSPPISESIRTDIHFARKSKIPKLPNSSVAVPTVRVSW